MHKIILSLGVPCLLAAVPATAETPVGVVYAGGTVSDGASGYAGAVVSLPGAHLGHGFALRAGAGAGRYHYQAGASEIRADYKSADAALVQQISGHWGWANFSAGPRFTDTRLSPMDPDNARGGSRWDVGLQADGALNGTIWRLGWLGSYGVSDDAYLARLQLGRELDNQRYRVGLEGAMQGDPTYRKLSAGPFFALGFGHGFEAQVGGVSSRERGQSGLCQQVAGERLLKRICRCMMAARRFAADC